MIFPCLLGIEQGQWGKGNVTSIEKRKIVTEMWDFEFDPAVKDMERRTKEEGKGKKGAWVGAAVDDDVDSRDLEGVGVAIETLSGGRSDEEGGTG